MSQPWLWSNFMHFQVLILTSSMSGKSKKSYWQAFSYAGDSIHEAFYHLGSVPLESTVADALEKCICKLSWPFSSRLWCLTVSLLLFHWYPGSGVILAVSIPDPCRLSYFVLASHRCCSTHCVEVVDKKLNCKNCHFQELCFSKVSNVRSTSAQFGKPHLSLILTNQYLTIMVRSGTVINIVPLWWHYPCADPEGEGVLTPPWKKTSTYMGFYRNWYLDPPPWKKLDPPPLENNGTPLNPW